MKLAINSFDLQIKNRNITEKTNTVKYKHMCDFYHYKVFFFIIGKEKSEKFVQRIIILKKQNKIIMKPNHHCFCYSLIMKGKT